MRSLIALTVLFALASAPSTAQSFEILGGLPGGSSFSTALGVSADGSVVVGYSSGDGGRIYPFRWEADTLAGLPVMSVPSPGGIAIDVADDGTTVVGWVNNGGQSGQAPARWIDGELGLLSVANSTHGGAATGISGDGRVIVGTALRYGGTAQHPTEDREAFRWTEIGSGGLGYLPGTGFSGAAGVSSDGSRIAGTASQFINEIFAGFLWENGSIQGLGSAGVGDSFAEDISADGRTVVGNAGPLNEYTAAKWDSTGISFLPGLPDMPRSIATGVSEDGSVIVGYSTRQNPFSQVAWVWTEADGTRSIAEVLTEMEVDHDGWILRQAHAVSNDGLVIVGQAWFPVPLPGSPPQLAFRVVLGENLIVTEVTDLPNDPASQSSKICDVDRNTAGLQCTLRAAIAVANAKPGSQRIKFKIEGAGPHTIGITSALPAVTDEVTIDGTTQPGTTDVPTIRVDGAGAGATTAGLMISANNVVIRGLTITSFGSHGIHVVSGDNGVIESLFVGTDPSGADGIGNGGDGIHIAGGSGWQIGTDDSAQRSTRINIGSVVAGNLLNGLYLRDPDNAALISARPSGQRNAARPRNINLNVNGLIAGVVQTLSGPVARPNGENGVCILGGNNVKLKNLQISDAVRHALEISASQNVNVIGGLIGLRVPSPTEPAHIGSLGESAIRVSGSVGVLLGSSDPADGPIQGGGSAGWFMDVEDSEDVAVLNTYGGITQAFQSLPVAVRERLKNRAGGLRMFNTTRGSVGTLNVATVFANNGGDIAQPQAGIFAGGQFTEALRVLNVHLGTTPSGATGIGNAGSGMQVVGGVLGTVLGGDTAAESIVSGNNGGYGFLFQDVTPQEAGRAGAEAQLGVIIGAHLTADLVKSLGGEIQRTPNTAGGFCFQRVQSAVMRALTAGPSTGNGIEVLDSQDVEIESASVGSFFDTPIQSVSDIAGPHGDGIRVLGGARISIGSLLNAVGVPAPKVHVNASGGRAVNVLETIQLALSNLAAGVAPAGSSNDPGVLSGLGNALEAVVLESTVSARVDNLLAQGNGLQSTSGTGGLLSRLSQNLRVTGSTFGRLGQNGQPERPNAFAAMKAVLSDSVRIDRNRFLGHQDGVTAESTTWFADGNTFEAQGALGGDGNGIRLTGGFFRGIRNTFRNNTGAAVRTSGGRGSLRFGNLIGNFAGIFAEGGNQAKGAGSEYVATENWWGDASGPSGAGPGSGDSVTGGVDFSGWLSGPVGVIVLPDERVVEAGVRNAVELPVRFLSPLVGADNLNVTVSDERGWITSSTSFSVAVGADEYARATIEATMLLSGADEIVITAVSQTDPTLVGAATIVMMPVGTALALASTAEAGSTTLDADGAGVFEVGGDVIVNLGGATEERGTVTGFGSILLQSPLRFDHGAGENVVPANRLAVAGEGAPANLVPTALAVSVAPNPTRNVGTITIELPEAGDVRALVYDALGRRVADLVDGPLAAGTHTFAFDPSGLAPGVYVVRATADGAGTLARIVVTR